MQNYARKIEAKSTAENLIFYPQIQQAFAYLVAANDEFTEELIRICEIPAPPFKEAGRAAYIKQRFEELGLTQVRLDLEGNVIAERRGKSENPNLIVSAHLDTVFPEGTDVRVKRDGRKFLAPGDPDCWRPG